MIIFVLNFFIGNIFLLNFKFCQSFIIAEIVSDISVSFNPNSTDLYLESQCFEGKDFIQK